MIFYYYYYYYYYCNYCLLWTGSFCCLRSPFEGKGLRYFALYSQPCRNPLALPTDLCSSPRVSGSVPAEQYPRAAKICPRPRTPRVTGRVLRAPTRTNASTYGEKGGRGAAHAWVPARRPGWPLENIPELFGCCCPRRRSCRAGGLLLSVDVFLYI